VNTLNVRKYRRKKTFCRGHVGYSVYQRSYIIVERFF
jgi:hypothetical protein